jgi:uncharacterized membrane protein YraQ (UPF0718 family)
MINQFFHHFNHYIVEILPAIAIGFFISGLINEFIPTTFVEKHLGKNGIKPILYSTVIGTLLPVCCWGSLPIAVSFYMKGASLGSVLAFLVATPATSVSALLVTWRLLGIKFACYIFFSVIIMGLIIGIIGNRINFIPAIKENRVCPHCREKQELNHYCKIKSFKERIKSIFKFAFIDMPKDIGLELLIGLILAALVNAVVPIGIVIKNYLSSGIHTYLFALIFGLIMYFCATSSVPLVHALITQGMNIGAGFVLLLIGPITSYGTILVIRKEFGMKILIIYLSTISIIGLLLGYSYSFIGR